VKGRFAPSPTGALHLGRLRTALVAWRLARSASSRFALRIEDLDPQRSQRDWERVQLADLRSRGWRLRIVCTRGFCSRAEIRAAASAPHGDLPDGAYPGTCRALPESERRALVDSPASTIVSMQRSQLRVQVGGREGAGPLPS